MDLDQLRTFDRIVRDQSFTKAAASLYITQATASMRIRVLKQILGVQLFTRGRTVTLTDHGMIFLPYARRMVRLMQEAREALRIVERWHIAIGSLRTMIGPLITDSLLKFQESYPHVDVVVREGRQSQIVAMLHEREIVLGILCWPNLDPLMMDLEPLVTMRERVPLVAAPSVAARLPENPSADDLVAAAPRVIRLRWWQVEPEASAALTRHAHTSVELPTEPGLELALRGEGIGYFVHSAVAGALASGALVEINSTDMPPLYRDTAIVVRNRSALDRPMLKDFVDALAAQLAAKGEIIDRNLG